MTAVVVASRRNVAPLGLKGGAVARPAGNGWNAPTAPSTPMPGNTGSAELAAGDALVHRDAGWRRLGLPWLTHHPKAGPRPG